MEENSYGDPQPQVGRLILFLFDHSSSFCYTDFVEGPLCLIERASTERFAAEDPLTRRGIAFIERNLKNPKFSVNTVAEHVGLSLRSLERTFAKQLGITVLAATQRARVRNAKSLLRTSTLPINLIASECVFSNHRRFGIVFRASTNMTPSAFRTYYDFDKL